MGKTLPPERRRTRRASSEPLPAPGVAAKPKLARGTRDSIKPMRLDEATDELVVDSLDLADVTEITDVGDVTDVSDVADVTDGGDANAALEAASIDAKMLEIAQRRFG